MDFLVKILSGSSPEVGRKNLTFLLQKKKSSMYLRESNFRVNVDELFVVN